MSFDRVIMVDLSFDIESMLKMKSLFGDQLYG